ncbi:hypothetical protein TNCV_3515191 [Trichonephila clavipes]|nr:hypothetical protein TNCV_3515191 [Trichonephila clavipes]
MVLKTNGRLAPALALCHDECCDTGSDYDRQDADWSFSIADLLHSLEAGIFFGAALQKRIPIAVGNFDAQFPP